jgi:hypothetical protein
LPNSCSHRRCAAPISQLERQLDAPRDVNSTR